MNVLGGVVTGDQKSADHAFWGQTRRAEKLYWASARYFTKRASIAYRIAAWTEAILGSALYAAGTWVFSMTVAAALKSWELQFLRRVLKHRPQEADEGGALWRERTARMARKALRDSGKVAVYE